MYKLTLKLTSPINFLDEINLDGILNYCAYTEKYRKDLKLRFEKLDLENIEFFNTGLAQIDGLEAGSIMFISGNIINSIDHWRKKWDDRFDFLCDFAGKRKKVRCNGGSDKSYDMPMNINSVSEVFFFFEGDPERVKFLLENFCYGIGKKVNIGYGWYSDVIIEPETKYNFSDYCLRAIPETEAKEHYKNETYRKFAGFKNPYWLMDNQSLCVLPFGGLK